MKLGIWSLHYVLSGGFNLGQYRLATGWTIGVRFPAGAGNSSPLHRVQTGSEGPPSLPSNG